MESIKEDFKQAKLNQFRFEVMQRLAKGNLTAGQAKKLCGATNAINQNAVYVVQDQSQGRGYIRVKGGTSTLAH